MISMGGFFRFGLAPLLAILLFLMSAPAQSLNPDPSDPMVGVGDRILLNPRGVARNESTDPKEFVFTVDVFSLATGQRVGTATDYVFCASPSSAPPGCLLFDVVTTFRLPDGEIVNHFQVNVAPDPVRTGFVFAGARPKTDSIASASGAYAGRTGKLMLSGEADFREFPDQLVYDFFTLIQLNPK